jgi:hypothetical protein
MTSRKFANNFNELDIDEVLIDLKVVSQIGKGQKLLIVDNLLDIDKYPAVLQPIFRWYHNDNRSDIVDFLKHLIQEAERYTDEMIKDINAIKEVSQYNYERSFSVKMLLKLRDELANSQQGLNNGKNTYNNSITIKSKIELLVDRIDLILEKIDSFMLSIEKKKNIKN